MMSNAPKASDFDNPTAYKIADILWRNGRIADVVTPEELFWLKQAPAEIENLQKLASDAIGMLPMPRFDL
jgi:hypothetical protein